MRWDTLSAGLTGNDATRAAPPLPLASPLPVAVPLPLAIPGAVRRTFDTPGFAGITFHEVQAKSIINRVPVQSRVPFEWTINPYRGCSHACTYCLAGDTPILMADGTVRPIANLRPGDSVFGTELRGPYRRYVTTQVLDHWPTVKRAYRVSLADGTELITSGDHRLLAERGWRQVADRPEAPIPRPALTNGTTLMGTGRFATAPTDSAEYRRGYLTAVIRAEADLGAEAVARMSAYLGGRRVPVPPEVAAWPSRPDIEWHKGFLAGLFDAQGSCGKVTGIRIEADDAELRERITVALDALGFEYTVDGRIRLRGGLVEQLRFFHTVDPAILAKRVIAGRTVRSEAPLAVRSVEPLGFAVPLFDITTGTGDFVANGVISHNCFARNTHTYLDLDAGHDFDSQIIVKVNAGRLLRKELGARKWTGAHIAMGTNVDVYQRAEGRYRLMREILAALRDFANPFSILTKGTLILRDLDLLKQAAEVTTVGLSYSVGFVDEALWRAVEPGTPSPRRRLDAVRRLTDEGFAVGVLVAPILPGLTDTDESIEATVAAIAAAGAVSATPIPLHLRPGAREWYREWLGRTRPDLLPRYRELFGRGSYSPQAYQKEVTARVRRQVGRYGIGVPKPGEARQLPLPEPDPPDEVTQLTLL